MPEPGAATTRGLKLQAAPQWLGSATLAPAGRVAVLVLLDTVVFVSSVTLAILVWAVPVRMQSAATYFELWPLGGLFLLAYAINGLYPGFGLGAIETVRRLTISSSFVFVVLAAGSFVLKTPDEYSRMTFFIAWAGLVIAMPTIRYLALGGLKHLSWWGEPALVVGAGELAERTITALAGALSLGYRPQWVVSISPNHPERVADLPVVGQALDAEDLASRGVKVALVAVEEADASSYWLEHLQGSFRHVILIRGGRRVPIEGVEVRNLGGILGIEFKNQLLRRRNAFVKRALDIALAGVGLLFTLPVVVLAAIAVRVVSHGPAFFAQERQGRSGKTIRIWKLRTMFPDAETRLEDHLNNDSQAREEWERRFKLTRDPRVLPVVGRVLRRFSIDELPQLWNVLKGDMSLVGPRPFPEYHLERFSSSFLQLRRRVRPGVTGLWQVLARHRGGLEEQEDYDTYYIRNWSLWMDMYILARTALTMLTGRGQ